MGERRRRDRHRPRELQTGLAIGPARLRLVELPLQPLGRAPEFRARGRDCSGLVHLKSSNFDLEMFTAEYWLAESDHRIEMGRTSLHALQVRSRRTDQ